MKHIILPTLLCAGTLFSFQTHAIGEIVSDMADGISDAAKTVGGAVSETAGDVKDGVDDTLGRDLSVQQIEQKTNQALSTLFKTTPAAEKLSQNAEAILVFPEIVKAGIGIGGQYGEGALRVKGKTSAYYNTVSGSYGLQLGAQQYGYAMFFMSKDGLKYLNSSEGWEVGVGPSIVVVDEGMARTMTTTTAKDAVYVFIFSQKGLMAGLGLQGTKINQINPQ